MSGTTISSVVTVGIVLTSANQSPLTVLGTGSVYATGYYASAIYSAINTPATIVNSGVVYGGGYGINLHDGGTIINGGSTTTTASVSGGYDGIIVGARAPAGVTNFGTISSTNRASGTGVNIGGVGTVINGAIGDTSASIAGYFDGVFVGGPGVVTNSGTITASGTSTLLGDSSVGVYLRAGGIVTNGNIRDSVATIAGVDFGVEFAHSLGTVVNFGTIHGSGTIGRGVMLVDGGQVVNGDMQDTHASIVAQGKNGVYCGGTVASTVTNMGTITGGKNGVALQSGGTVVNGSHTSTSASISGARQGVYAEGLLPTFVANAGTLRSTGGFWGVSIYLQGAVANGGPTNTSALIAGGGGVYDGGLASVLNYGIIAGTTRPGVDLKAGGALTNFGTVTSSSGTAVYFGNGDSLLQIAPGAKFGGIVQAGTGSNTIELLTGAAPGTLGGLGSEYINFGTLQLERSATWTLNGPASLTSLAVNGTLTANGSIDVAGELSSAGNGLLLFGASTTIEVGSVLGSGPDIRFLANDTLTVDHGPQFGNVASTSPTGPLLEDFRNDDAIDLRDLPLAGVIVLDYFSATGELRVSHGSGAPVAILFFDPSTLGSGSFHIAPDNNVGTLITHN